MASPVKERTLARAEASSRTRYEDDYHAWILEQVALLAAGRLSEIDAANIAEELADVGKSEYRSLEGALAIVLMHLLKWDHQEQLRSRSWVATIREHRRRVTRLLRESPSLRKRLAEATTDAYADGRDRAVAETGLPEVVFPTICPYAFDDIMARPITFDDDNV